MSFIFNPFTASLDAVSKENINDGLSTGQMAFWDATLKKWVNTEISELFWDDVNKRLGIGTDSPDYGLDIETGKMRVWNGITGPGQKGTFYLGDGSFSKEYGKGWYFGGGVMSKSFSMTSYLGEGGAVFGYGGIGSPIAGTLGLYAGGSTPTSYSPEKARILANGNVGIGTTSPTALLHLKAGTTTIAPLKLTEGTLLTTPEKGTVEFADNKFYITNDGHQRVIDRTSDVMLESVTVENTTVETLLFTATMDANSLFAGNTLKLRAFGIASNVSASDVLTIRVKVGGVTKVTIENSARTFSDEDLHISGDATQRTVGVSGERAMHFDLEVGGDNANFQGVGTIDTTSNMDITITAQWSNAKTGNTVTLEQASMQYKN